MSFLLLRFAYHAALFEEANSIFEDRLIPIVRKRLPEETSKKDKSARQRLLADIFKQFIEVAAQRFHRLLVRSDDLIFAVGIV